MAIVASIVVAIIVFIMFLLVLLLVFLACKPWRFFSRSFRRQQQQPLSIKVDEERPLVQEDSDQLLSQRNEPLKFHTSECSHLQTEGLFNLPGSHSLTYKQRLPPPAPHSTLGGSLVLDIGNQAEDLLVGQTLRRPLLTNHFIEEQKCTTKDGLNHDSRLRPDNVKFQSISKDVLDQGAGSCLSLEVITGPACGLQSSVWSTDTSKLPLTLGRVPPSEVVLKDSEVSGKHAMIKWNSNKLKWELIDMGSLNGTLLNTKAVHHPDFGSRTWGEPKELVSGDVITLGTTSQISVQITPLAQSEVPVGVGIASDPMSTRRGGKRLPMEDVCYYQWPLPGAEQFGLFGICDGHGGAAAAESVSKILPETVATILLDSLRREKVFSRQDASDVLREAISQTEACLNHYYEGCTATVLLVWGDGYDSFFAQCANVGDSACIMNIDGRQIKMTEDHRITSYSERQRINKTGNPLKDGDTRLCGLNLGRMLGDKFLKEQDARFSSEPYISQVVPIGQASEASVVLASDGLWDVISAKKANQFVLQAKERYSNDRKGCAQKIANFLLNEARKLRTKDNTSVVYVDFDSALRSLCKYEP
ncbi:protein phosphatase 2C 70 isoform X1 [Spinacia oleracea]|uniref:protein-serine/threonine phosphatase n=1 Tax=Spinacia oleracea TaxID=3562 RepID=A0A9R0J5L7_SPIOL|nr:protein phosphatase 2C 70 isoform X1 [Spinacia oleracea]